MPLLRENMTAAAGVAYPTLVYPELVRASLFI
jgi:hypothetical protein